MHPHGRLLEPGGLVDGSPWEEWTDLLDPQRSLAGVGGRRDDGATAPAGRHPDGGGEVEVAAVGELGDVAVGGEAGAPTAEDSVVARVEELQRRAEARDGDPADVYRPRVLEEVPIVDRQTERTGAEHSVEIELHPVPSLHAQALAEPAGEPGSRFEEASDAALGAQELDGGVEARPLDEEIDVGERSQGRVAIGGSGEHRPFQRSVGDPGSGEVAARLDQQALQSDVGGQRGLESVKGELVLVVGRRDVVGLDGCDEVADHSLAFAPGPAAA